MSNTIVNTNMGALHAHRSILSVGNRQNRASERLSSGQRINRAADDAAGLSISEDMRNQIRGLNKAVQNSQDGISLIQTADGALEEAHRIVERIRVLNVQGANDTYSQVQRNNIAHEIADLIDEFVAIEERTLFNGRQILRTWDRDEMEDNSIHEMELQVGANAGERLELGLNLETIQQRTPYNITGAGGSGIRVSLFDAMASHLRHIALSLWGAAGDNLVLGTTFNYTGNDAQATHVNIPPRWSGEMLNGTPLVNVNPPGGANPMQNNGLTGKTQPEWISFMTGNADAVAGMISTVRATLGATQNRLDHAINSLSVASENLSAANSRIRDTDMASEMMNVTQANVLQQAAMSMLAQANQDPQNILQLVN